MNRRDFLKGTAAAGAAAVLPLSIFEKGWIALRAATVNCLLLVNKGEAFDFFTTLNRFRMQYHVKRYGHHCLVENAGPKNTWQ